MQLIIVKYSDIWSSELSLYLFKGMGKLPPNLRLSKIKDAAIQMSGICVMTANRTIQFESYIVMNNHIGPW